MTKNTTPALTVTVTTSAINCRPCTAVVADYGLVDERGRSVGGIAKIYETTTMWRGGQLVQREAVAYCTAPQAARNGVGYGASQSERVFPTMEEAQAYAVTKFTAQAKAYAKKYAATATV
jgi:hypothetical protein